MFEDLLLSKVPRQRRRLSLLLSFSVAGHAIVMMFLIFQGYWSIAKLPLPRQQIALAVVPPPPPPPPPPRASKKNPTPRTDNKVVKRMIKAKDLTQPTEDKPKEPNVVIEVIDESDGVEGGVEGGVVGGVIGGLVGGVATTMPGGMLDRALPPPPKPPPPPVLRPTVMPQKVVEQQRLSGNTQIEPDIWIKKQLVHDGRSSIKMAVKMCLDVHGRVARVAVLSPSGYPTYDDKIVATMRTWQYRPFFIGGQPAPVCTSVTFIYQQR